MPVRRRRARRARSSEGRPERPERVRHRRAIEGLCRVIDEGDVLKEQGLKKLDAVYLKELPNKFGHALLMADGVVLVDFKIEGLAYIAPGINGTAKEKLRKLTGESDPTKPAWEEAYLDECLCGSTDPEKHAVGCPKRLICTCGAEGDDEKEHDDTCDFYEPEDGYEMELEEDDDLLPWDEPEDGDEYDADGYLIKKGSGASEEESPSEERRRVSKEVAAVLGKTPLVGPEGEELPKSKPLFKKASTSSKVFVVGDAYPVKDDLKSLRFRWDPTERYWWKRVPDSVIDRLKEQVEELGDVSIQVVT